jgi:cystathionine gamma-synthase
MHDREPSFDTLAVHAGAEPDELTGAVAPPIYQTSTFQQDGVGKPRRGYEYARSQNPTRERLERAIATLESGKHGFAFASGSAATAAIAELAAPGDEVVVGDDVYGGTFRYLERVRGPNGVVTRYADLAADPEAMWEALSERTRLVWFETPTNPLLKIVDIEASARVLRDRYGGGPRPLIVVDNTFASPILQRPLDLGADIVFHSATKYLAGHSDVQLGAIVTRDDDLYTVLKARRDVQGNTPGPFEAWLALRGLRTLHLRVERAQANAAELARRLADHPMLTEVRYPGLGAMVSIVLPTADHADLLVRATALWVHATSLGGVESSFERRRRWKSEPVTIPEGLVRLSVGIEDVEDLWADLSQALDNIAG